MVRAREGSDPAAVVFDAIAAGKSRKRDTVLVDTAGRLHTRANLMHELEKIKRVETGAGGPFTKDCPLKPVIIESVRRV